MTTPVRTCVSCGRKAGKDELVRFVWDGHEPVRDDSRSAPGRGAYSCEAEKCLKTFITQQRKWKRVFRL